MVEIKLKAEHLDADVLELIYDKQAEFRKAAQRVYSAEKTVNRLLRDYIKLTKQNETRSNP